MTLVLVARCSEELEIKLIAEISGLVVVLNALQGQKEEDNCKSPKAADEVKKARKKL